MRRGSSQGEILVGGHALQRVKATPSIKAMPTVIPVTSITTNTFSTNGRDHGLCRQDQRVRALSGIRFHDEVKDTNPCQFSVISDPFPVSVRHCETCVEHDSASRTATLLVLSSAAARAWFIAPDFRYSHRHLGLGIGESGHAHTLDLFQAISNFPRFFLAPNVRIESL